MPRSLLNLVTTHIIWVVTLKFYQKLYRQYWIIYKTAEQQ